MLAIMGIIAGVPAGITSCAAIGGGVTSLPVESFGLLNPWLLEALGLLPPLPPGLFGKGAGPPSFNTCRVAPEDGIEIPPLPASFGTVTPVCFACRRTAAPHPTRLTPAA